MVSYVLFLFRLKIEYFDLKSKLHVIPRFVAHIGDHLRSGIICGAVQIPPDVARFHVGGGVLFIKTPG